MLGAVKGVARDSNIVPHDNYDNDEGRNASRNENC